MDCFFSKSLTLVCHLDVMWKKTKEPYLGQVQWHLPAVRAVWDNDIGEWLEQEFKACLGNIIRSRLKNKYMEVSQVPEWTVRKMASIIYISEGQGRGSPHSLLP